MVVIEDMHQSEVASKAKPYGVRTVPAIVVDGKLAGCCVGRGPDELPLSYAPSGEYVILACARTVRNRSFVPDWRAAE